jgi:hypothetical protein
MFFKAQYLSKKIQKLTSDYFLFDKIYVFQHKLFFLIFTFK